MIDRDFNASENIRDEGLRILSGAGTASDAKQKGGEASCPKDESASRRKFSGEATEAHALQPWVVHGLIIENGAKPEDYPF